MTDLGLTGAALQGEWWRLWSGHLVHWNAQHFFANAVAAVVPFLAVSNRVRMRMLIWGAAAAPLLSVFVLHFTNVTEMRGASGLAVGFWFFAGLSLLRAGERRLGVILLAAIATKLIAEATGFIQPHPGYVTLSSLHYAAAVLAVAAVMLAGSARLLCRPLRGLDSSAAWDTRLKPGATFLRALRALARMREAA